MKNSNMPAMPNDVGKVYDAFARGNEWDVASLGLTKREYFAGLAMQGLLACSIAGSHKKYENLAAEASFYADALLKGLEK